MESQTMDDVCQSRDPETDVQCTQTGDHELHVAFGASWTAKDIEESKDATKVLVKELRKTRAAIERVAVAIEHHTGELLHKTR
jgi:hypothetical protein